MEMKYYNASNNFRAPIRREPKPYIPQQKNGGEVIVPQKPEEFSKSDSSVCEEVEFENNHDNHLTFVNSKDDLLLVGLILLLLLNQCDDFLLLLVLGYLLFCDKK